MTTIEVKMQNQLAEKEQQQNLRTLKKTGDISPQEIFINGNKLINFASNDYLGLSHHPLLKERSIKAIERYGVGNPSSRLIAGNCELYEKIESTLARLKGTQAAIVFPTGFQTNCTVLSSLAKLDTYLFCDRLCHNSILLGAQLEKDRLLRFKHNDILDLQRLINKEQDKNKLIVTESVFSMDGDLAPIADILDLANNTQSYLYVDEAHATGVFGQNGMGLVSNPNENTIIMGTFGKGGGSFGAYIACSQQLKNYLVNFCSGLIYTTALPPAVLGAIEAALELIPHMVSQRQYLLHQADIVRTALTEIGFNTGASNSQIVSILIGDSQAAISLSKYLEENSIYAPAIRPPTVPHNTARIRLSISAIHSNLEIEYLLTVLKNWYASQH